MNAFGTLLIFSTIFIGACSCSEKGDTKPDGEGNKPEATKDVTAYVTTADSKSLFKSSQFNFTDTNVLDSYNIMYDKTSLGNEIDGFGLAVTTATCYNLLMMSREDRSFRLLLKGRIYMV